MIEFQTLAYASNKEILECFNDSFSDYSIPFSLNLNQLEDKLISEDIDKKISVGAFNDGKLVGFILHGSRTNTNNRLAYNGGTGVRPTERGKKLTKRMYDYIIPILRSKRIESIVLEVISDNIPAIKSYESTGFQCTRDLNCYAAKLNSEKLNIDVQIKESEQTNLDDLSSFGEIKPSWQNANETILHLGKEARYLLAYYKKELCGYCIMNSRNMRILQIAVKKEFRKKGVGHSILKYVEDSISDTVSIINVDNRYVDTLRFLERNNFRETLVQKEMLFKIAGE